MKGKVARRVMVDWEKAPTGVRHADVSDVVVDADDNVYLLTRMTSSILVYDKTGAFLRRWGEDLLTHKPHGLTIAPNGNLFCVDELAHTVFEFSTDGAVKRRIGDGRRSDTGAWEYSRGTLQERTESIARPAGPFNRPTKAAIARDGDIYVADGYGNARIHRFGSNGELIHSWGKPGGGESEFRVPHSLCLLGDEKVLVADRDNQRIQIFDREGGFIEQWTGLQRPAAIAIAPNGVIVVAEMPWLAGEHSFATGPIHKDQPPRIVMFDQSGGADRRDRQ